MATGTGAGVPLTTPHVPQLQQQVPALEKRVEELECEVNRSAADVDSPKQHLDNFWYKARWGSLVSN